MIISSELLIGFAAVFFLAAFIHGSIGFGFPMVATPLLALVTDIQTAIILTLIPTILVNLVSIKSEGNLYAALRQHLPLALYAMTGGAFGTYILMGTASEFFMVLLAIAIVVYLFQGKIKLNLSWIKIYPRLSKLLFGISAGLLGGLTNVMAPVLIIFSLESAYSKKRDYSGIKLLLLIGKVDAINSFHNV